MHWHQAVSGNDKLGDFQGVTVARSSILIMLILACYLSLHAQDGTCFDPLSGAKAKSSTNPADNDPKDWKKLID
jgi:hypothetical protein